VIVACGLAGQTLEADEGLGCCCWRQAPDDAVSECPTRLWYQNIRQRRGWGYSRGRCPESPIGACCTRWATDSAAARDVAGQAGSKRRGTSGPCISAGASHCTRSEAANSGGTERHPLDHCLRVTPHTSPWTRVAKIEAHAIIAALDRRIRSVSVGEPVRHENHAGRQCQQTCRRRDRDKRSVTTNIIAHAIT